VKVLTANPIVNVKKVYSALVVLAVLVNCVPPLLLHIPTNALVLSVPHMMSAKEKSYVKEDIAGVIRG
jgi:hypothetical protein